MPSLQPSRLRGWHPVLLILSTIVPVAGFEAFADPPRSWLESCPATRTEDSESLELQIRRNAVLKLDSAPFPGSGVPIAQLLGEPSFTPDWVVSLYHPKDDSCVVVAVLADKNVYYANHHEIHREFVMRRHPARIGSETFHASIPCATADKVGQAWQVMLRRLRPWQQGDPVVMDGVGYTALQYLQDVGPSCGYSHSPPEGSPADRLRAIAVALLNFCRAKEDKRPAILMDINTIAAELIALDASQGERP